MGDEFSKRRFAFSVFTQPRPEAVILDEMIRAVLRGGPLSGEAPKFKEAANMRSSS
jgi:hypothetical protein